MANPELAVPALASAPLEAGAKAPSLARRFSPDLGIDLGSATARVMSRRNGVMISEPSVVARDRRSGEIRAVGREAEALIARVPEAIEAVVPVRDGALANYEAAEALLRHLLGRVKNRMAVRRPRIVIAVPCEINPVEKRAFVAAGRAAGAREVLLLATPMAAALGAAVPAAQKGGKLVIDVGAATVEVALVTLSGVVHARTLRLGGAKLDSAIHLWMKRKQDVEISLAIAREIKEHLGCAIARDDLRLLTVNGRDRVTGELRAVRVKAEDVREAIAPGVAALVAAVREVIEDAPAELSADIAQNGIVLVGGGALLDGLAKLFTRELRLPVSIAKDPVHAAVRGCYACLDRVEFLQDLRLTAAHGQRRLELAVS